MRKTILLLGLAVALSSCIFAAEQPLEAIPVAGRGETTILGGHDNLRLTVKIYTHEVPINDFHERERGVRRSRCTGTMNPCRIVDDVEIYANDRKLFIPLSVFSDISDLTQAQLSTDGRDEVLVLRGGDASESFIVKIGFDAEALRYRRLYSAVDPNQAVQEAKYNWITLVD